jgi:hypothetical protein
MRLFHLLRVDWNWNESGRQRLRKVQGLAAQLKKCCRPEMIIYFFGDGRQPASCGRAPANNYDLILAVMREGKIGESLR